MEEFHTRSSRPVNSPQKQPRVKATLPCRRLGASRAGFTIVELLVVVVVIAILAAITIVAYNGITASAKESALKSDLSTTAKKLNVAKAEDGSFPGSKPSYVASGLSYRGESNTFCVSGSANNKEFRIKETGRVEEGNCSLPVATTMQTFTAAHCSALATFTGSNSSAVVNLTDSRGGTTRTYDVAKLADGKCWMLTNLKLGSTSGPITLTPADSNVASNFTLPQLITGGAAEFDLPLAYGPVTGDTGSGSTNYGHLYNWSAATAGASRTTNPAGSGNAANSICPANWRLPSGGLWNDTANEFSNLNARMAGLSGVTDAGYTGSNYYSAANAANWQFAGPLRGVFAGYSWGGSFFSQGSGAVLWSQSASASYVDDAYIADFDASGVYPANASGRADGLGVRCLLN